MVLERWEYGDPEEVAARREEAEQRQHKACGQCTGHHQLTVQGKTIHFCERRKQTYGHRCQFFKIRGRDDK